MVYRADGLSKVAINIFCQKTIHESLPENGINQFIQNFAVFENGFFQAGFQFEAGFFQHPLRGAIAAERSRIQPDDVEMVEGVLYHFSHCLRHDAPAPERFRQPVAHFGAFDVDVCLWMHADPTCCMAIYFDSKNAQWVRRGSHFDKIPAVLFRVRMRELVGQVFRNVEIVGVLHQVGKVVEGPGPEFKIFHVVDFTGRTDSLLYIRRK